MVILVDTNVILDVILMRDEFISDSYRVMRLCYEEASGVEGYAAAHGITNLYYILRKDYLTKSDEMFDMKSIVASAEERDLLRKELEYKAAELHYLLDTTAALLGGKRQRHKKENAKTLVEKWDYMLGATDCDSLIEKFSAIKKSAHTDEETVRSWFDFLAYLGLSQFFAQAEEIILSPKNRRFFENGRLYKDGKQFFISKYPWRMNDDLLIRGELYGEDES